jgi:hypothetical protein
MECCLLYQGGLGVHDLELMNGSLLPKWLFNLLTEDGVWRTILRRSTLALKRYPKCSENLVIHIFWLDLWRQKSISSHMVLSLLRMDLRKGSQRIYGYAIPLSGNNILLYTILYATKAIP